MRYKILNGYEITNQQFWDAMSLNEKSSEEDIRKKYGILFRRFSLVRDSIIIIFNENSEVCGYICFFPISAQLHKKLVYGKEDVHAEDIMNSKAIGWEIDNNYIHIVSIEIKEEFQDGNIVKYLSSEFCKYLSEKQSRGIKISDMTSFATNWCGNKWLQLHGFHKERETTEDTIMRCSGEDLKELLTGRYNHPADTVYFVTAVSIDKKTDDDLKKEHKVNNIRYGRDDSYENFLRFLKSWDDDKYSTSSFLSSIHMNLEEAKKYAKNNIGDINESGSYEYAVVSRVRCSVSYYNSEQIKEKDFWIYKYNRDTDKYEEIDSSLEEYYYVLKEVWGYVSVKSTT